jgi:hypothetical protein
MKLGSMKGLNCQRYGRAITVAGRSSVFLVKMGKINKPLYSIPNWSILTRLLTALILSRQISTPGFII